MCEKWPHRAYSLVEDVMDDIEFFPSAGVFLKATGELVSWVTILAGIGMSRLHTLEQHRRKGYAKLAILSIAKKMALGGQLPFTTVAIDNAASIGFFESLGFQRVEHCHIYHSWV